MVCVKLLYDYKLNFLSPHMFLSQTVLSKIKCAFRVPKEKELLRFTGKDNGFALW